MRYRIELSSSRTGFARVNLPDRVIEVEAAEHVGQVWQVKLTDQSLAGSGSVNARADNANDAVWRVGAPGAPAPCGPGRRPGARRGHGARPPTAPDAHSSQ